MKKWNIYRNELILKMETPEILVLFITLYMSSYEPAHTMSNYRNSNVLRNFFSNKNIQNLF